MTVAHQLKNTLLRRKIQLPEVTDWDKDRVDLRWTPPVNDGGSPITGYVVEKREKGSPKWTKACETGPFDTKTTVPNLDEGVEYEFRVRAVNDRSLPNPEDVRYIYV